MKTKTIIINDWQQPFLTTAALDSMHEHILDAGGYEKLKNDLPSLVIRMTDRKQILKLVRARQWVEYVKLFWNRSRISKEINGNRMLARIGVKVPAITETGFGLLPSAQYDFIGFYVMEDLEALGFIRGKNAITNNLITAQARTTFFDNIAHDVIKMREQRLVFNDFKLGNIFCNASGDTAWIDTGISYYPFYKTKTFREKHNIAMDRFLARHRETLNDSENSLITSLKL